MIEQWVIDRLNPLKSESLIILADPQRMIRAGARAVDGWAKENGFTVLFCSGNLALREMYENLRDDPIAKIILVDRTRDKAKLPLFFPDLEARCKPKARLTIGLRDFLTQKTGDQRWPLLVNTDRNIGRLILENLPQALQAHQQLREVDEHRFTDSDLFKIVLGAALGINPFHKLNAGEIRRLCIANHERLEQVRDLFTSGSSDEASEVLDKLREQINQADKPWCWMLDHDPQEVVRAFTLAAIMHQHGIEYDVLLDNFESGLGRYQKIPKHVIDQTIKDMLQADPDQMVEDVGQVETFLKEEPEKRLAFLLYDRCKIDDPGQARSVLLEEKLSGLVRSMALLSLVTDLLTTRNTSFHKAILAHSGRGGHPGQVGLSTHRRPPPHPAVVHPPRHVPACDPVLRDRQQAQNRGRQAQSPQTRPA